MWSKFLPWRFIVRQAAKQHKVIDPFEILAQLSRFAQPADVVAPTELLRAGFIFHTRGLMNSQAIQHNLDWVWPYWVECQFNPTDKSFIPRAFSLTHVNLTHRNWTAVGLPDSSELPIVDPRGLLTPFWDGWSIDCWLIDEDGHAYLPSRAKPENISQRLVMDGNLSVETILDDNGARLIMTAEVIKKEGQHYCRLTAKGLLPKNGWLVVSLRPFNPEGVSFIRQIEFEKDKNRWLVDNKFSVNFQDELQHNLFSYYRKGDVFTEILSKRFDNPEEKVDSHVRMATAAALFGLQTGSEKEVTVEVPLINERQPEPQSKVPCSWNDALSGVCRMEVPDRDIQFLYDAAIRTVILHSVDDIYPGPYTYKRFWFRDAVLILNAMLSVGMIERAERMLDKFFDRQTLTGYFRSQEGEWDSNGQVLWIITRFFELTGKPFDKKWSAAVDKGVRWIKDKRTSARGDDMHAGLLPAGFSAEHFGPNDYYYWDDFWAVDGLQSAARYFDEIGDQAKAKEARDEARDLFNCIESSLKKVHEQRKDSAMPSSPYRRMDSGAIGSIVCNFPLQIHEPKDKRVMETVEYLLENCMVENGFFHDMSHSGINPYLTLHIAQVLLRADDERFADLIASVVRSASATGQWPEAIHPITKGGCMGDGQHVWAAAEWIMMIRNCFVREEGDHLVLCSGVMRTWLETDEPIRFGPVRTVFGELSLSIRKDGDLVTVSWDADWYQQKPEIYVKLPGNEALLCPADQNEAKIDLIVNSTPNN